MSAVTAPARILVVEDDDSLRTAVVTTLRAEGFSVAEVADGRSIAADLDRTAPDLVLLDWMLPGRAASCSPPASGPGRTPPS